MHAHPTASSRRGSVLIVAMLLAAIIGISLVSYIKLANNSLKQATRSFYANSAMNVAEIGLEQAVACFNQLDNSSVTTAWSGWTIDNTPYNAVTSPLTPSASRTYNGFSAGPDATAAIKVYVHYHTGSGAATPVIVAQATITQPNTPTIDKYIEVVLAKRSLFSNGLVARNNITWSGTPSATSWNSDPDNNATTPAIPYTSSLNTADVVVASLQGSVALGNGTVWGYAKTGPSGAITGGTVQGLTGGDDLTRRTHDFNATFPVPTAIPAINPNNITSNITSNRVFGDPSGTDTWAMVNGVQTYYYVFSSTAVINLTGSNTLRMKGNCVFLMNSYSGTGTTAINITGNQGIVIDANASLSIYTNGNINMTGNSSANNNAQPVTMQIYGTNPTSQTITMAGTADLKAVIDAPTAAVSLSGTVSVQGSVIADTINMNGTPDFIFDDSLANLTTGNPYRISNWRELQSKAERDVFASALNF